MKIRLVFAIFSLLMLAASSLAPVAAHGTSSKEVYVRVVSANPDTRTYTFSCSTSPENSFLRDWFIRPDNGDTADDQNEAAILDKPSGQHLTYTFPSNTFYHIGCLVWNDQASELYRGDLHLDLRGHRWDPEIFPLSGSDLQASYECRHGAGGIPSWEVVNAYTGQRSSLPSGNPLQHSVSGHGLYDYICHINGKSTGLPVEYFDSGQPYFPDAFGVPHGITNVWNRNGSTPAPLPPPPPSGSFTASLSVTSASGLQASFLCDHNGGSSYNIDWFADRAGKPQQVLAMDVKAKEFSYTFAETGSYNVTCGVWSDSLNSYADSTRQMTLGSSSPAPPPPSNGTTDNSATCTDKTVNQPCVKLSDVDSGCRTISWAEPGKSAIGIKAQACKKPNNVLEVSRQEYNSEHNLEACFSGICVDKYWGFRSGAASTNTTTPPPANQTYGQTDFPEPGKFDAALNIMAVNGLFVNFLCDHNGGSSYNIDWFADRAGKPQQVLAMDVKVKEFSYTFPESGAYTVICGVWSDSLNAYVDDRKSVTVSGTSGGQSTTFTSLPIWIEPTNGLANVAPNFFHLAIQEPSSSQNVASTDWEIWKADQSERLWSAVVTSSAKYHVHTPDGTFEGSLAGQQQLQYGTAYKARMRLKDTSGSYSPWAEWRAFTTSAPPPSNFSGTLAWTAAAGFRVEKFATGFDVPVHVVAAPQQLYQSYPESQRPFLYVTELYGQIKVVYKDGSSSIYADNLLNFDPFGSITGGGQMGLVGLYIDPQTGDLFASMTYVENDQVKNEVERFYSTDDGKSYTVRATVISNLPSAPSHQVQQIAKGPDGKLYVALGDADTQSYPQSDTVLAGKIISMNMDGSDVQVYAKGFRNPFGIEWRPGMSQLFATDNAPDTGDRLLKVNQGGNYGWCCSFPPGIAPLNVSPVDVEFNPGSSGFPDSLTGKLYVAVAGPVYQQGPVNGKHILEFTLDANGNVQSGREFVKYTGSGYGTPIGMDFAADGLYFTDIYGEPGFVGLGETEANIYRVVQGEPTGCTSGCAGTFRAGIQVKPWYPKDTGTGIEYVFQCDGIDGSGNYLYDWDLGDGKKSFGSTSNTQYNKYPYGNKDYTVSCTVNDKTTGKEASASMVINPDDFIFGR
ncbi:PQQ-dependent sugar dehydrogenase [Candidatus Woesearchaeota archaeon]|nr:PQQ-dependent sugar dehydrogenase [Candidatus Woesearchaeota archaeon]